MIVIPCINGSWSRELTTSEKSRVRKVICDGVNYNCYEDSDTIPAEPVSAPPVKWAEMLRDLLTPGGSIITRMRSAATASAARQTDFTTILLVMQNGVNGFPDENTLGLLLSLNWGFTAAEKTKINNYLSNNGFSISI